MKPKKQIVMKPIVGSIVHFEDPSKRYIVVLNDVRVNGDLGFLARLLANSFGHEMDYFHYKGEKFTVVEDVTEKEQRLTVKTLEQLKDYTESALNDYMRLCNHHIVKENDDAHCSICDANFGWWCPESEDHSCHYYSENGLITLNNDKKIPVPDNHDSQRESDDWCVFCGHPEERK